MNVLSAVLALLLQGTPVEKDLPDGVDPASPWKLLRAEDRKEIPFQIGSGGRRISWIAPSPGAYRLEPGKPEAFASVECLDRDGKALLIRVGGKDVLRYNYGLIKAPEGVPEAFDRSGYIHPVWTPSGRIVSNDFPKKHRHHHGIWFPWTSTEFEGRKVDFWNSGKKQGRIECIKVIDRETGPVYAQFRSMHRFIDLTAPEGPKTALYDAWMVRVYALADRFVFDLLSIQNAATDSPLVLKKYRYGGLGFRGSAEWEGQDVEFLTSEGKTRKDGHGTRARWCTMYGKVKGADCAIGFMDHPMNFRAPQTMRIHPGEPFFNWAPVQLGEFKIERSPRYTSTYRFVVADGTLKAEEMDARWKAYTTLPEVTLTVAK